MGIWLDLKGNKVDEYKINIKAHKMIKYTTTSEGTIKMWQFFSKWFTCS